MNFTSSASIFASSFLVGLSGAMMPGPLLAVTVRNTIRRGFVAAPLLVLGHGILELALLSLLMLGLAEWLAGDAAAAFIALAGSAALVWMGSGMFREARSLKFSAAAARPASGDGRTGGSAGLWRPVADGILASVTNPYWSLWWATIGLGYLAISGGRGAAGVACFFAGHILADAAWYLFVGMTVSTGRGRFSDRIYRGIVGACAVFLFLFAVWFGCFGFLKLFRLLQAG